MMAPDEIIVNPVRVLMAVAPRTDSRTSLPVKAWAERMLGSSDSRSLAITLRFLVRHCGDLDELRDRANLTPVTFMQAMERDLSVSDKRTSALAHALEGPIASDFARMLDGEYEPIARVRATRIRAQLADLQTKLRAVSEPNLAPLTFQMADGLADFDHLLKRTDELGLWLLSPESLVLGQDRLLHYGLTLERVGLPMAAKLAISLALTLAGIFPPLAMAAMGGSLALLAADGWNEEEFFAKRAALKSRAALE